MVCLYYIFFMHSAEEVKDSVTFAAVLHLDIFCMYAFNDVSDISLDRFTYSSCFIPEHFPLCSDLTLYLRHNVCFQSSQNTRLKVIRNVRLKH